MERNRYLPANTQGSLSGRNSNAAGLSTQHDPAVLAIARIQVGLNIEASADHARVVCEILSDGGWTDDEIVSAGREIATDPECLTMIRRAGAITPEPFAELRRRREAAAILGPCHTYDCKRPATVAAWGDVYCAPCHAQHVERQRARDYRLRNNIPEHADAAHETTRRLGDLLS